MLNISDLYKFTCTVQWSISDMFRHWPVHRCVDKTPNILVLRVLHCDYYCYVNKMHVASVSKSLQSAFIIKYWDSRISFTFTILIHQDYFYISYVFQKPFITTVKPQSQPVVRVWWSCVYNRFCHSRLEVALKIAFKWLQVQRKTNERKTNERLTCQSKESCTYFF